MVLIFGIEIDDRCADYLKLVVNYASSGNSNEQEVRRRALRNLSTNNCRRALVYLIDRYASSGNSNEQEVRRKAFDYLEDLDG